MPSFIVSTNQYRLRHQAIAAETLSHAFNETMYQSMFFGSVAGSQQGSESNRSYNLCTRETIHFQNKRRH
jgi:hypothetical protein